MSMWKQLTPAARKQASLNKFMCCAKDSTTHDVVSSTVCKSKHSSEHYICCGYEHSHNRIFTFIQFLWPDPGQPRPPCDEQQDRKDFEEVEPSETEPPPTFVLVLLRPERCGPMVFPNICSA